jgi:predicted nucleic acid-binding protein
VRKYLLISVGASPSVLAELLKGVSVEDPLWDISPDPERFTLREVVAHLADWEPIHAERIQRILAEETPTLDDMDEGAMALERNYAHQDPLANLQRYAEGRKALLSLFKSLSEEQWQRAGIRPPVIGHITIEQMATLVLAHDGYHFQQVVEWLSAR